MGTHFEWDEEKNKANIENHRISFDDALNIFEDENIITLPDSKNAYFESREISIGRIDQNKNAVLVVAHTERNGRIRIISARKANKKERGLYYACYKK